MEDAGEVIIKTRHNIEKIEAARAKVKAKIQEWAEQFQAENKREPTTEDKGQVKHLYEKYRRLQQQLGQYQQQLGSLQYAGGDNVQATLEEENTALRERVAELEAELARARSGTPKYKHETKASMRENNLDTAGLHPGFALEQEIHQNEAERQAYMADKRESLEKMSQYSVELAGSKGREEVLLQQLREQERHIHELEQAPQLQRDKATGEYPIPAQWIEYRRGLTQQVQALQQGLQKAVRYQSRVSTRGL